MTHDLSCRLTRWDSSELVPSVSFGDTFGPSSYGDGATGSCGLGLRYHWAGLERPAGAPWPVTGG